MSASPEDMEPRRSRSAQVNPTRNDRRPAPAVEPGPPPSPMARRGHAAEARRRAYSSARSRAAPSPGRARACKSHDQKVDIWSAQSCFYVCEMAVAVTTSRSCG
jgi:hypothetical protein